MIPTRTLRRFAPLTLAWMVLLGTTLAVAATSPAIPLNNAGFETAGPGGLPADWAVTASAGHDGNRVAAGTVAHDGAHSLMITNAVGDRVTVSSAPVTLEVGQLYRLSGWIRTAGVQADPLARYPTALGACVGMASLPFTNNSPTVGGNSDWRDVSVTFFATRSRDRVQLHLGRNGTAVGTAWFDGLRLEKVDDITTVIPLETVRWYGPAFRYDDQGWIFVHIEGEPYERGVQYGHLVPDEIVAYMTKLGIRQSGGDAVKGWNDIRFMCNATFLRKYDTEYLEEMKGIADGAAAAGARFHDRPLDLVDIVAVNSVIDLGQLDRALDVTATALSGRNYFGAEDELDIPADHNKCSSFVATGSSTTDGRFVFGQIFMWSGYTGVHWNVICDIAPSRGHRLVYQTFPGGIHSGADFYINDAGIVIGETTVGQTPYDATGTPQSNRIRKAAQYADSIDEAARILREHNNGMYTNDWTMADTKTDEGAVFLLGTHKWKLWRTGSEGHPADTPGDLKDYIWANNNNRDPEVRKEYIPDPENAPYDLIFTPWNRDVAFNEFYRRYGQGQIDSTKAVALWASSPINRAHACDGKITTAEMAEKLVFLAHYGKTTLREKMVGGRWIPDLPGAEPHLTLGYSVISPIFLTDKLQALHRAETAAADTATDTAPKGDYTRLGDRLVYPEKLLWANTVFPHSAADNWFISATAGYWRMMRHLPDTPDKAFAAMRDDLAELNSRYLYVESHEGALAPVRARRAYDRYGPYQFPRIKGIVLLHQLRLLLGNTAFSRVMNAVHETYADKEMTTADFLAVASREAGRDLAPFVRQWLERDDLPDPAVTATAAASGDGYRVTLDVTQPGTPWHVLGAVAVETDQGRVLAPVEIDGAATTLTVDVPGRPTRVVFNAGADFPVRQAAFYTFGNIIDDFHQAMIVYGTSRQVEANHTLALDWRDTLSDAYLEFLLPVCADAEVSDAELAAHDLMILGGPADNALVARLAAEGHLPLEAGRNLFSWRGRTHAASDEGLLVVRPNPWNPKRVMYLLVANSALELYHMTHVYRRGLPTWTLFKGDRVTDRGYHAPARFELAVEVPATGTK